MQQAGIYDNTISTIFIISFEKPKSTIACWTSNFIKRNNTIPCDTMKTGITTNCKRKNIVFNNHAFISILITWKVFFTFASNKVNFALLF